MKERIMKIVRGDKVIWIVVLLLMMVSMLVIYSASESYANRIKVGNGFVLLRHSLLLLLGFAAMVVASCFKYKRYARILTILYWISIPLLIYTLRFGSNINHASRVIEIAGQSFQTSDMAKIALIGYMARVLTLDFDKLNTFKDVVLRVLLPVIIIVALIFPENLSTAVMLFVVCLVMMFLSGMKMKYIMSIVGIVVLAGTIFISVALLVSKANPGKSDNRVMTWVNRVERFFSNDKETDSDANFQAKQAEIAVASGGFLGKLPGKSSQRNVLPHVYSDFVYAIIIEEYGFAGGFFVMIFYMIILYRAMRIMHRAPKSFGAMLSMGLAFSLVMQAMVNIGVSVGLLPVTGQPLPFVSMGGTSLLFTGASLGIIISVSKDINKNNEGETKCGFAETDS